MKNILLSLSLFLTCNSVFAENISKDMVSKYGQAVLIAMGNSDIECHSNDDVREIRNMLTYTQNTAAGIYPGTQPLLIFSKYNGDTSYFQVKITTSEDFKSIIKIALIRKSLVEVNLGNLENPVISKQWQVTSSSTCSKH